MDTVDQPPSSPLDSDQSTPQAWVSLDEAASRLGVSIKTLRRRIQKGQIQAQKVEIPGGFTYRVQFPPQKVARGIPILSTGLASRLPKPSALLQISCSRRKYSCIEKILS